MGRSRALQIVGGQFAKDVDAPSRREHEAVDIASAAGPRVNPKPWSPSTSSLRGQCRVFSRPVDEVILSAGQASRGQHGWVPTTTLTVSLDED
jgi:hypothetical protein